MGEHIIAKASEIGPGGRIVASIEGREIAVFNLDGEYYAYLNWCAHQGGPTCEGKLTGTRKATFDRETLEYEERWLKDGEIIICPWHQWEYDLETGECLSKQGINLPSYPVWVEDGEITVSVGEGNPN